MNSNISKGLFFIVTAFPLGFFIFILTLVMFGGSIFPSDTPIPESDTPYTLAMAISGFVFIAQFVHGVFQIFRKKS